MKSWRVGIAGLGTVGGELLRLLQTEDADDQSILSRARKRLEITGVSARNRHRQRPGNISGVAWFDDPIALAQSNEIDIFVELIGGVGSPAREAVTMALESGKHVVTANKALLAEHGLLLASKAEEQNLAFRFEAAVAGGIPIISAMRSGAAACSTQMIAGILNGTCNYILTRMETHGLSYSAALQEAQELGYAEVDPALDVGGYDAAHKLAILCAITFGKMPALNEMAINGIAGISHEDVVEARKLGYSIRLLGMASRCEDGSFALHVGPYLVRSDHAFAGTKGGDNHVLMLGTPTGLLGFSGPGAGAGPTASAVAGDLIAIMRGAGGPVFGHPAQDLATMKIIDEAERESRFYIRVGENGDDMNMTHVSSLLEDNDIAISTIMSGDRANDLQSNVLVTEPVSVLRIRQALIKLEKLNIERDQVSLIPIANFTLQ